jgi:hypothetical protein
VPYQARRDSASTNSLWTPLSHRSPCASSSEPGGQCTASQFAEESLFRHLGRFLDEPCRGVTSLCGRSSGFRRTSSPSRIVQMSNRSWSKGRSSDRGGAEPRSTHHCCVAGVCTFVCEWRLPPVTRLRLWSRVYPRDAQCEAKERHAPENGGPDEEPLSGSPQQPRGERSLLAYEQDRDGKSRRERQQR